VFLSGEGKHGRTAIVPFHDDSVWVNKRIDLKKQGNDGITKHDAEELTSYVSDAFGAGAPPVIRTSPLEIWMPFVEGRMAVAIPELWNDKTGFNSEILVMYTQTDRGLSIGMMDFSIDNDDRNPSNWIVGPDGLAVPYDHGNAAYLPYRKPGSYRPAYDPFLRAMTTPRLRQLPYAHWVRIQRNLDALEPVFADRDKQQWYQNLTGNFAELRRRAKR
jgi:hypothetical protein